MDSNAYTLNPLTVQEMNDASTLIRLAMNEAEGKSAGKPLRFHFDCHTQGIDDGREYYLWKEEGTLRGIAGLHHDLWGPKENVWLSWFAVHPDVQGKGLGGDLLHRVEERACTKGYRKLLIETYASDDFSRARTFYANRGYRQWGEIRKYLPDGSAMIVFGKELI